jgi:beta-phosphoglucomutase
MQSVPTLLPSIQLVIFDLDGVLVETDFIHSAALKDAVINFVDSIPEYLDASDGLRTTDKIKLLQKQFELSDDVVRAIATLKHHRTLELLNSTILHFSTDAPKIFSKLKAANKQLALASNTRREYVDIILDRFELKEYFDVVIAGDEIQYPKPHPLIFLECMRLNEAKPENTLIFEDSINGLKAAYASKAHVFKVAPELLLQETDLEKVIL